MPTIHLLYSPGIPATYSVEVDVDLGDSDVIIYDRRLQEAIMTDLANEFDWRSVNPMLRGSEWAFYHKGTEQRVSQEQLNEAAQEAVYNHLDIWPLPGLK